ncbi:3-dehydrosphinganine reductase TSC10B-like [Hibiscus syriacus]|nr:3-dehydrosphinganine reductase TSC10B-like [Hibiscus syriacus]
MGIGLAIAKQAASEGARISLLARSLDQLEKAKQSICEACDVEVSIFSADVRDYVAVERAVNKAGPIDVLVVNHGVYYVEELETQELDVVKSMIDVNLMGSFNVIKAALPSMKRMIENTKGLPPLLLCLQSPARWVHMVLRHIRPPNLDFED